MNVPPLAATTIFLLASGTIFAQEPTGIRGHQGPESTPQVEPVPAVISDSPAEAATTYYDPADVPIHVKYEIYMNLEIQSAYDRSNNLALDRVARTLGITSDEVFDLIAIYTEYRTMVGERWDNEIRRQCQPYLLGQRLTNEVAVDVLTKLDDSESDKNAYVMLALDKIERLHGASVRESFGAEMEALTPSIEYSKRDLVRYLSLLENTEYADYFNGMCASL